MVTQRGTFVHSFVVAFRGLGEAWINERNFRVQTVYALVVVTLLLWLKPETAQSLLVVFALFGLLSAELMNTAVERVVDLAALEYHPLAGSAKDIAAGSVLMLAIGTAVINVAVFAPLLPLGSAVAYVVFSLGVIGRRWAGGPGL